MNFLPNDQFSKPLKDNAGMWIVTKLKIKIDIIDALKETMKEMVKEWRALSNPPSTFLMNETLAQFRDECMDENGISMTEFLELKKWAIKEGVNLDC